ncbi:L,D-transpeptidase [Parashewanella spongiae]|uniref:L,D-transpeptidase n=1 Tax=Parashewanella spongiae TaxID=342950 RepID=A0A3A6UKG0_9GAMM|nr:L,D-transpeptidase [Parashewanella spongiae]MCL1077746.1 L,D-transpeptidase [Parashewanella spongiae]RJY18053.1 L,D-transpeptidase [Parashewanella spongiae]
MKHRDISPCSALQKWGISNFAIQVNTQEQLCYVFNKEFEVYRTYPISTSKKTSNLKNSSGTPFGMHIISKRIGDGVPIGERFVGRKAQNEIVEILKSKPVVEPKGDYILTRILQLKGQEQGVNKGSNGHRDYNGNEVFNNVDSFERYVYFHGTNEEYKIGSKASHGCIRMKNEDIVDLFSFIQEGSPVYIELSACE